MINRTAIAAATALGALVFSAPAFAQCTVPNTLTNGQVADATEVMDNFEAVAACADDAAEAADAAVTPTGSPATGAIAVFSGGQSIAAGNLSGDVTTAGGTATTLATTGVTAGSYSNPTLTVDAKGRITAATSGSGGGGTPSGTVFPGSPASGDRFYRSDRNIEYFWDGTRWLSTQLFVDNGNLDANNPLTATNTLRSSMPFQGDHAIYVEKLKVQVFESTTTTSNYFTIQWLWGSTGSSTNIGTAISTQGQTQNVWVNYSQSVNQVVPTSATFLIGNVTETGTAQVYILGGYTYRLVG